MKEVQERSMTSKVYWHQCPGCDEDTDETTNSYAGEELECPLCGTHYVVQP